MHNVVEAGKEGGLFFGFSHIFLGTVGDEFFMTRGHVHQNKTRSEYYWCVKGKGVLVLMDKTRDCRVENVNKIYRIGGSVRCFLNKCRLNFDYCYQFSYNFNTKNIFRYLWTD